MLFMACAIAPAIAAGDTVVCKPPPENPLSSLMLARACGALPPGVLNADDPTRYVSQEILKAWSDRDPILGCNATSHLAEVGTTILHPRSTMISPGP